MCGRFTTDLPGEFLVDIFGLAEHPAPLTRFNIAPTQLVPVIRQLAEGQHRLDYLHWGLIPYWAKERSIGSTLINARSETAAEKPAFRQALRHRRCLVVASGFYEWKQQGKIKLPQYIRLKGGVPMLLAGLWESWRSPEGETVESCTILTTASNPLLEAFHQRMPVILHPDRYLLWLDRRVTDPALLAHLFQPYPCELMEMWPVSPLVNTPRNDSPELILPVGEALTPSLAF